MKDDKKVFLIIGILVVMGVILLLSCNRKKEIELGNKILSFSYSYSTEKAYCDYNISYNSETNEYTYKIKCSDGGNKYLETVIDESIVEELNSIIKKHNVKDWNGFNEFDDDVDEGKGFSLVVGYENGSNLSASGYAKFPNNYETVHKLFKNIFQNIQ